MEEQENGRGKKKEKEKRRKEEKEKKENAPRVCADFCARALSAMLSALSGSPLSAISRLSLSLREKLPLGAL